MEFSLETNPLSWLQKSLAATHGPVRRYNGGLPAGSAMEGPPARRRGPAGQRGLPLDARALIRPPWSIIQPYRRRGL